MHLVLDLKSLHGTAKVCTVLFLPNPDAFEGKWVYAKEEKKLNWLMDGLSEGAQLYFLF